MDAFERFLRHAIEGRELCKFVFTRHLSAALEAIAYEIESLRHERARPDELERAKQNFLASEHFERESVSGQASKLGSFEVLGGGYQNEALWSRAGWNWRHTQARTNSMLCSLPTWAESIRRSRRYRRPSISSPRRRNGTTT